MLNISGKLYCYILNKRLNNWIEDNLIINDVQAGFRKKYSTVDHIFTLSSMVQKQLLNRKKLYVAFIDFRKAYDSINREKLWEVLQKRGVGGKMFSALQSMYRVVKARVRVGGELTDSFLCPRGLKQGEICSPVIFSLFINELASDVIAGGRHGVQLSPDVLVILILLFADDVALTSDTPGGLQTQINILYDTAQRLDLEVNLEKSNIVVFRNGGYLSRFEHWNFGDREISIVNMYKYLGIFLSTRLSFSHTLNDLASRARKGVIGILRVLWAVGERSPSIFFKLFDAQIVPMLTYGAEVWGPDADLRAIESVHLFALKRFLNVSIKTPNAMVYGETGRCPLSIVVYVRCIRYWLQILRMPPGRIPHKAYNMLLQLHSQNKNTWASYICYLLYRYGFGYVWENQGVGSVNQFLRVFKQRLIDCWRQDWHSCISAKAHLPRAEDRFRFYSEFKSSLVMSSYLVDIKHVQVRNALIRFRLGVSCLKTHRFRFGPRPISDNNALVCPFCPGTEETELHFMLVCPKYVELRERLIPKKFFSVPSTFRLTL